MANQNLCISIAHASIEDYSTFNREIEDDYGVDWMISGTDGLGDDDGNGAGTGYHWFGSISNGDGTMYSEWKDDIDLNLHTNYQDDSAADDSMASNYGKY